MYLLLKSYSAICCICWHYLLCDSMLHFLIWILFRWTWEFLL